MHRSSIFKSAVLLACCFSAAAASAQQDPIRYDAQTHVFHIDAAGMSYVFGVNEKGELQSIYWGQKLQSQDAFPTPHSNPEWASFDPPVNTTPQEFLGWGAGLYAEPDLKITFPDGNRDLVLHYLSHAIHGDTLTLDMKDISRDVVVHLEYKIDSATGILRRSATVENKTAQPFTIEQAASGTWNLPPAGDYQLRYLTGRWGGEWSLQKEAMHPGKTILESRRGSTGHQNNPWFAIERGDSGDEDHGNVWFGALAWSGSWQLSIEQMQSKQVRVTGGFNPFDFAWLLKPGQSLPLPDFYGGYSSHGIGGASRLLHRFELANILPESPHPRAPPRPLQLLGSHRV